MADQQRPGQRLINYIRFIKDHPFYFDPDKADDDQKYLPAPGEMYLWNMSQKEFDEVTNSDWGTLVKKYGVPKKYRD